MNSIIALLVFRIASVFTIILVLALLIAIVSPDVLDELEHVLAELFSVVNSDVEWGHSRGVVSSGVRPVRSGRIAGYGVPVFVRARPEVGNVTACSRHLGSIQLRDRLCERGFLRRQQRECGIKS